MNPELDSLVKAARSIKADAKTLFGKLNVAQLNWKPDAKSWSVGQCLEHLIVTTNQSFPAIEQVTAGDYKQNFWTKLPFLSSFIGAQILKAVAPENKKKVKAPKVFRPMSSSVDAGIVENFVNTQQKLVELMEATKNLDAAKIVIASPIASFITYSLFDAYKIAVYHERRHFRQAQNVMKLPNFPD